MKSTKPPGWIDKLLEWYCSDQYLEEVQGDLHEWYHRRERKSGRFKARLFYLYDVIAYFRLFRIKKLNNMENGNNLLIISYLKMTVRQFKRNLRYSLMNTLGLTVGILSTLLISLYILDELSYDRFHENHDEIYRLVKHNPSNGGMADSNPSAWKKPMMPFFPEITDHTRLGQDVVVIKEGDNNYLENGFNWADANFMSFFSFEVLSGDRETMLTAPNSIVLTRSKAMRYFGKTDVVGELLPIKVYDGNKDFVMQVSGVIEDVPRNSHLQFDLLGSMATTTEMYGQFDGYWNFNWVQSYVRIPSEASIAEVQAKVPDFFKENLGATAATSQDIIFQPLSRVRLYSKEISGRLAKGDINYIYLFSFVALLIVLAASINYVNLTTAKSTKRGKEVGMRKVFGAARGQVVTQFYMECGLQLTLAFVLAIAAAMLLLPAFSYVVDKHMVIADLLQWPVLAVTGILFLLIFLLSGIYPAAVMNRFRPIQVLKGNLSVLSKGASWLRKGQVLVQFAIATFLISSTLIVLKQMELFNSQDIGFRAEQLINIPVDDRGMQNKLMVIKDRMQRVPGVNAITASGESLPSAMNNTLGFTWEGRSEENQLPILAVSIDYDFFETIETEVVLGRNYTANLATDSTNSVMINEAAYRLTGWTDLENKRIEIDGTEKTVVGVVENFNYNSLHSDVAPVAYTLTAPGRRMSPDNLILRMEPASLSSALSELDAIWSEFSDQPFDFSFVDQSFARLYGNEQRFTSVVIGFALVGVFLAVLGLVSLVSFTAERRSKEISIHKVLGASKGVILSKVGKQFVQIFLVSVVIGLPLSRLVMERWLQGFAYRTEVSWVVFLVAALIAICIVLGSIGLQALKVARANPTHYLSDH
ncbi:MAG: ABC transporter permease [Roseivirga sp.]